MAQRVPQLGASLLIAALIPRTLGADTYGRYALLTSLSMWFIMATGLGFTQTIARTVPHLRPNGASLRQFLGQLLALRIATGGLAAGLYLAATALWLREIDLAVLALIAGTVLVRCVNSLFFEFFLGLNQAARWGMGQVLRSWISLGFVLAGYALAGLMGVAAALLATELALLLIVTWWNRREIGVIRPRWSVTGLWPLLRLGLLFYASDMVLSAYRRSGEALVRLVTGDYVQVAQFGLAYDVYLTAALWLPQLVLAFGPYITLLLSQSTEAVRAYIQQLLKTVAILTLLVVLATVWLGPDLVPLVLGREYAPVARNLAPLVVNLIFVGLADVERLVALVMDRPLPVLIWAIIRLAAFWGVAPLLIARWGAFGGCVAILIVNACSAVGLTVTVRRLLPHSLRAWLLSVGLAAPAAALAFWPVSNLIVRSALFCGALVLYGGLLLASRVVRWQELRAIGAWFAPAVATSAVDGELS
jgi:O-antigen/teichoic acid export membrane protein